MPNSCHATNKQTLQFLKKVFDMLPPGWDRIVQRCLDPPSLSSMYRCILFSTRLTNRPFLYVHLAPASTPLHPTPQKFTWSERLIQYGEYKWHDLSQAPSNSIKGRVYRVGKLLIDKIPAKDWMLWRAYALHRQNIAQPFVVENYIKGDHQCLRLALKEGFDGSAVIHRRWAFIHGFGLIPGVVLALLPGGKLLWAWLAFRFITHQRASIGAKWLSSIVTDPTTFALLDNDPDDLQHALAELPELRLLMDKLK